MTRHFGISIEFFQFIACVFSREVVVKMITLVLVELICFIAIAFVVNFWWKNRRYYELLRKIPKTVGHLPIIGIAHNFLGANNVQVYDIIKEMSKPGPVSPKGAWLGPTVFFLTIDDVDQVNQTLASKYCHDRPPLCDLTLLDHGILFSSGELWKSHRKMIEPAFNTNILRSFYPIFNDTAKSLIEKLNENVNKEIEMYDFFAPFALQNILLTTGIMKQADPVLNNEFLMHTKM